MSNTSTIAKNTMWYGIERGISALVAICTSIAIARALGPTKTGYIVYVTYIAGVVANLGTLGIAAATRKYMAEFLGQGEKGIARYIFRHTLALQTVFATVCSVGIVTWVIRDAEADYRTAALLIALSIWPSMMNAIPAQANTATENMAANIPASITAALGYLCAIFATVIMHWGVVGIGASLLLMRWLDFLVRFFPTTRRIRGWELSKKIPADLRKRMIGFSWKSVTNMLLSLIVWERCEVLLLKTRCADIRQLAFYSIAFSMANQLLIIAIVFGAASATTTFAQYGRDKSRLPALAANSFRYIAMTSIPLHFVVSALAIPALKVFYGRSYIGASTVMVLAPLLCLPRAFLTPIQSFFFSTERQTLALLATIFAAVLDVSVAWALIPAHGAVGACIGSGVAQITAVGLLWGIGIWRYKIPMPWTLLAKVVLSSVAASGAAYMLTNKMRAAAGLAVGTVVAAVVLMALFYLLRVLEVQDLNRFETIVKALPHPVARRARFCISILARRAGSPSVVAT